MDLISHRGGSARLPGSGSTEPIRFGVVIPVHDEEELAPAALAAIGRAVDSIRDGFVAIGIAIVLDSCSDRSSQLVAEWRQQRAQADDRHLIEIVTTAVGSVGHARKLGCAALLRLWADHPPESIWLATTDADSEVPRDWIAAQLKMRHQGGQVWVGPVSVRDWSSRSAGTAEAWSRQYESEYLPIHGANFGIDAATYLAAGGFASLPTGEDRDLFERTLALGAVFRHDPRVRVVTSGRRVARAPKGFADALSAIEETVAGTSWSARAELRVS
jgi:glycosyltransferase involved in cell wall biosynthesis